MWECTNCAGSFRGQEKVLDLWSWSYMWLCATQCGCWESNPGPLQVFLTAEPFFNPIFIL